MGAVGEMAMQREEGLATGHPNMLPLKPRRERLQCAIFPYVSNKIISQQEKLK